MYEMFSVSCITNILPEKVPVAGVSGKRKSMTDEKMDIFEKSGVSVDLFILHHSVYLDPVINLKYHHF